jgi:hypothetical protein
MPVLKPAGAAVVVPASVSRRKPVTPVAVFVGMIVLAVLAVNVNVKPPTLTAHAGVIGPNAVEMVVGLSVTAEFAAIPKFPVDAVLTPGLNNVFDVVAAVMVAPVFTVATPPPPGVKPTLPLGLTWADAWPAARAATSPAAPTRVTPNFLISISSGLGHRPVCSWPQRNLKQATCHRPFRGEKR